MSTNVYVLRCSGDKWYVGKSDNVQRRFEEHKEGTGSVWTSIYRPLSIEKIYSNVSAFEEDKVVKELMSEYGIHNVRGGSYSSTRLVNDQFELLQREIQNARNGCWNCGRIGHFASECNNEREEEDEFDDEEDEEEEDEEFDDEEEEEVDDEEEEEVDDDEDEEEEEVDDEEEDEFDDEEDEEQEDEEFDDEEEEEEE